MPVVAKKRRAPAEQAEKGGVFLRVLGEAQQLPSLRQPLIIRLEKILRAKVITYFASFQKWDGQLSDSDAEMIENILASEHKGGGPVVLVCNSSGGQGMAAERIVNICRSYSNDRFEIIVPHMAKSAATMIALPLRATTIHRRPMSMAALDMAGS